MRADDEIYLANTRLVPRRNAKSSTSGPARRLSRLALGDGKPDVIVNPKASREGGISGA